MGIKDIVDTILYEASDQITDSAMNQKAYDLAWELLEDVNSPATREYEIAWSGNYHDWDVSRIGASIGWDIDTALEVMEEISGLVGV